MNNIKIHLHFIMAEADIAALDKLPADSPTVALTQDQKQQIESLHTKYITKNGLKKDRVFELYIPVMKNKWSSGETMSKHAAMRIVLIWLYDLQKVKELPMIELARLYKLALTWPEAQRIILGALYDFR